MKKAKNKNGKNSKGAVISPELSSYEERRLRKQVQSWVRDTHGAGLLLDKYEDLQRRSVPGLPIVVHTDKHQVLTNFVSQFFKFHKPRKEKDGIPFSFTDEDLRCYHVGCDPKIPISEEEFMAEFWRFSMLQSGGFGDLPFMEPNIVADLQHLVDLGFELHIQTFMPVPGAVNPVTGEVFNSPNTPEAQTRRFLEANGFPVSHEQVTVVRNPSEKYEHMKRQNSILMIEDNPETAVQLSSKGLAVLMIGTRQNKGYAGPRIFRLANRAHLRHVVPMFYEEIEKAVAERKAKRESKGRQ
jgi:hypothetical protein